ncbi:MAG: hypothetical protein ACFCUE_13945 [Candidatus Bathyarchaeia archaeon]|jgi:predicted transcriptional regulator
MAKIKYVLALLDDGDWHSIDSLRQNVNFSSSDVNKLLSFLSDYNLITFDAEGLKVKINSEFKKIEQTC